MIKSLAPATALPASLAELKTLLRIEHDLEDALLASLLRTATDMAEAHLGHVLLAHAFEQSWINCPNMPVRLQRGPILAVTQVTIAGQLLTAEQYHLQRATFDESDMTLFSDQEGVVAVTYTAGSAANWNEIAEPVRFGILRLAAHLCANRDSAAVGAVPSAVLALWQSYRKVRLI